jgi:hypothetical protein
MLPIRSARITDRPPGMNSWTCLVAETGGFSAMTVLKVIVRSPCTVPEGARLVVQESRLDAYAGELPLASMQRVLGREGLSSGLELQLFRAGTPPGGTVVQAWIDLRGNEELEFDGVHAQPTDASLVGHAEVHQERVTLVLTPARSGAPRAA